MVVPVADDNRVADEMVAVPLLPPYVKVNAPEGSMLMVPVKLSVCPKELMPVKVPVPVRVPPEIPVTVPVRVPVLVPVLVLLGTKGAPCKTVRSPLVLLLV